jgi:DNA-binding GntR family transcriptional regulator
MNTPPTTTSRPRGGLASLAYDDIKRRLLAGAYKPGERLQIEQLVTELRTSRQPIMDAMKRLGSEGFIEIVPQVGCRVVSVDKSVVADHFRMLSVIEGTAAEFAAKRRTNDEASTLRAIYGEAGRTRSGRTAEQKLEEARLQIRQFHTQLRAMAHSPAVAQMASSLWDLGEFYLIHIGPDKTPIADRLKAAHVAEEKVLEAVEAKRAKDARAIMEAHIASIGRADE